MGFRTRAFLLCFIPIALLLTGSFWAIQKVVQSTVRQGLRTSLRDNHFAVARLRSQSDLNSSRFLKVIGENPALEAGMQLVISNPGDAAAKRTLEDQLLEFCQRMDFDFLIVSDPKGAPIAGVLRRGSNILTIDAPTALSLKQGLGGPLDTLYHVASVPLDQGSENIGEIAVGEHFDLSEFNTPAVLIRSGRVVQETLPGISMREVQAALDRCARQTECEVQLRGETYLSLPLQNVAFGADFMLRSMQSVDAATKPAESVIRKVFLLALVGAVFATLLVSVFFARSIVKPIGTFVAHLKEGECTGVFAELDIDRSSIREIRDLTSSFNRAARAILEGRERLQNVNIEFVGSMASALDARDKYTAGHSGRVSYLACATAAALGLPANELQAIRMGALLHDIGKIGIADRVLQKPGTLTDEEFAIIKQHPAIGRRILKGVNGFLPYLDAVELHHENWDGTGYPHGQTGETTPLCARIIHVVDAFDAMTTDRPYRFGMSRDKAIAILLKFSGRQFDPRVVEAFVGLPDVAVEKDPAHQELVGIE